MTTQELKNILRALDIEYNPGPRLIYVFYQTDDGLVNNLSVSIRHGRSRRPKELGDNQLAELMQQYPDAADSRILAIERPEKGLTLWMDADQVCRRLDTSRRTLGRWVAAGLLHPSRMGNRLYFDPDEIERLIRSHIIQPNGRADLRGS